MVVKMIAGIRYSELENNRIFVKAATSKLFIAKPMPNIVFQRDPFASIVYDISLHSMTFETRRREILFVEVVFDKHPDYNKVKRYYNRNRKSILEGGDAMFFIVNNPKLSNEKNIYFNRCFLFLYYSIID